MFHLPKYVDLFKSQLPTDLETCLADIRKFGSWLFQAERSGNLQLLHDTEMILTHLRYRYIILSDATDDESLAFKLLYEVELPEMMFSKEEVPLLFGDFTLPITSELMESMEHVDEGIMLDEVLEFEPEVLPYAIAEETICDDVVPSIQDAPTIYEHEVAILALKDSPLEADYAAIRVEPIARFKQGDRCVPCLPYNGHSAPIVLGSAFSASQCRNTLKYDQSLVEIDHWRRQELQRHGTSIKSNYSHLTDNFQKGIVIDAGDGINERESVLLHSVGGSSIFTGRDYFLFAHDHDPKKITLQSLALSAEIRRFAMEHQ